MSAWSLAATVLLLALVPCGIKSFRGTPMQRLVGLEMSSAVVTLLLLLLSQSAKMPSFYDLTLTLALLTFGGALVFARFLERGL